MSSSKKRLSSRDFPPYTHLPGKTIHPNKPGGHQFGQPEPNTYQIPLDDPFSHELYCYGLDLLNHGHYWESHVAFEAIWNAHERKGEVADLLKALIKIGAAAIKAKLGQRAAAKGHLERARELIDPLSKNHHHFCGLDLEELLETTWPLDNPDNSLEHFLDHLKLGLR